MGIYYRAEEEKLTYRFYEPLVLLEALGRAQGDRVPLETLIADHVDTHDAVKNRRTLLDQLSIVCDFDKGGSTTTAIVLEWRPCGPCYWVSSPDKTTKRTVEFVCRTLKILSEFAPHPEDEYLKENVKDRLFRHFAEACKQRLIKTWGYLQRAVDREERQARSQDARDFLRKCRRDIRSSNMDLLSFCDWAYRNRKSEHLRRHAASDTQDRNSEYTVRHSIGRIASVFRAAEILTKIAPDCRELFEEVDIKAVPCSQPQPGPPLDTLVTLDGIARRMEANDDEYERLKGALFSLDRTSQLMGRIKEIWSDQKFKPRVHAEIELLEAVHRAGVQFYDGDRYIACSKAACFCCYHYICHHPGQFVRPASHNNLYLNWRAPELPQSPSDADAAVRRRLLNAMVSEFRMVARSRVLDRSGRRASPHPDSTTGITPTVIATAGSLVGIEEVDPNSDSGDATAATSQANSLPYTEEWASESTSNGMRAVTMQPRSQSNSGKIGLAPLSNPFKRLGLHDPRESEEDGGVPLNSSLSLPVA